MHTVEVCDLDDVIVDQQDPAYAKACQQHGCRAASSAASDNPNPKVADRLIEPGTEQACLPVERLQGVIIVCPGMHSEPPTRDQNTLAFL